MNQRIGEYGFKQLTGQKLSTFSSHFLLIKTAQFYDNGLISLQCMKKPQVAFKLIRVV